MNERGLTSVPDFVVDFDFAVTYPLANGNPSIQRKDISTTFATANKAYDQRSYTLDIKAISNVSQHVATTTILITLIDECRFATITPPDVPNMQLYLYQVMSAPFSASSIDMNGCNQIMYELEFISSTATTPTFVGFDQNGNIGAAPGSLDNIGSYNFILHACIMVGEDKFCNAPSPSSQFTISIEDPCVTGDVMTFGWTEPLQARQLTEDTLNLSTQIPLDTAGGVWPWYSQVNMDVGASVCGPIDITVTYQDGNPQDMVTFVDTNTIKFWPTLAHAPGTYNFKMTATLRNYGLQSSQDFVGIVGECLPVINSQAASDALADSVNITWGVTKAAANFGTLLNGYVQ